jgi:hypothetical protein
METKRELGARMEELYPIIREVTEAGGEIELTVTGDSMRPLFKHKVSRVRLGCANELAIGDIPLYRRDNGAFVLHRIVGIEDGTYTMCGDAQWQLERGVPRSAVVAVTVAYSRDGKRWVDAHSRAAVVSAHVWRAMLPLRHLYIGIRNRMLRAFRKR